MWPTTAPSSYLSLLSRVGLVWPSRCVYHAFSGSSSGPRAMSQLSSPPVAPPSPPRSLSESTREALRRIAADGTRYYAKTVIKSRSFTVTKGDTILMHRLPEVSLGDVLRLSQIYEFGSANYTLRGKPYIDPHYLVVRAMVLEHGRGQKVSAKQGKQRKGRRKKVTIKPHTTKLRILDVSVDPSLL